MFSATGILWLPAFLYGFFLLLFYDLLINTKLNKHGGKEHFYLVLDHRANVFRFSHALWCWLWFCDIYTLYINFSNDEGCYFFVLFVHRLTYHMFWSLLCWDHILCILVLAFWTILKSLDKSHIIMLNNVGDVLLSSFCYYFIRQMACSLWLV